MTESRPPGGRADPRPAGPEPEVRRRRRRIDGHGVTVFYENTYITISWDAGDLITHRFRPDVRITTDILGSGRKDLVTLHLDIEAPHSRLSVDLPFYADRRDQLNIFRDQLKVLLNELGIGSSGRDNLALAGPGAASESPAGPPAAPGAPPGAAVGAPGHVRPDEGAAAEPTQPDRNNRPEKRERQVLPELSISVSRVVSEDDEDWISLCPPAETRRLMRLTGDEPARPAQESPQRA